MVISMLTIFPMFVTSTDFRITLDAVAVIDSA